MGARTSAEGTAASEPPPSGPATADGRRRGRVDFGAFALDRSDASDSRQVLAFTPGLVFAGRYRLVARLARGGMGSVWSATDERLGREVAIKFMAPELADDAESRHRFEQEARAAAKLVSRHVVGIHDHGVADGIPFIVLERLDGEDLQRRLRREPRLPLAVCGRILVQAARALRVAQGAGIVHRDIKPQNLFLAVAPDGGEPEVKLLDFGVAKHAGTEALRTRTGILVGSPHFMSPEQIRGRRDLDVRSDLFSLAAVIYRCLTGKVPYDGDMAVVMFQITQGPPRPPSEVAPDLPREIDAFFARALASDRDARFATPTEMADAFEAIVARHPGAAPPPPVRAPAPGPAKIAPNRTLPGAGPESTRSGAIGTASDHPTIVGTASDAMGPPSSGPAPRASDAPTQVVAASQVLGFTQAGGDPGPSRWERPWAPPIAPTSPEVPDELPSFRGSTTTAAMIVAGMAAVLIVLVVVLLVS